MRTRNTVVLEILRRGLAFRQLLSPATEYQALCGNHEAVSVQIPFVHAEFLQRIKALRYREREGEERQRKGEGEHKALQLRRTAEDLARVLAQIPGLISELAVHDPEDHGVTHLRLILSAPELALLPFELAIGPPGFPGAGREIALQTDAPLTITREVRRVSGEGVRWPKQQRILFAAASPPGVEPVPIDAHLLELRRAIDSWVTRLEGENATEQQIREMVTVLPQASLREIQEHCAEREYTHVHILAHGAPIIGTDEYGKFGLALNDRTKQEMDIVDGKRLADALRAHRKKVGAFLSCPVVVTLASCDSANVGDVTTPGSSMAHTLHESGIAFVVASQFPLTVAGSITAVRVLYQRLLWGEDPRVVLHDLRQQLHQMAEGGHDWGSLVAYAALPSDLDEQLDQVRSEQARRAMSVAMSKAESGRDLITKWDTTSAPEFTPEARQARLEALEDLERAMEIMPAAPTERTGVVVREVSSRSEELGIRGATAKRRAWVHYLLRKDAEHRAARAQERASPAAKGEECSESEQVEREAQEHRRLEQQELSKALEHYRGAFVLDMATHWAAVQYLSLAVVTSRIAECPPEHWRIAHSVAKLYAGNDEPNRVQRAWAHASLLELVLLDFRRTGRKSANLKRDLEAHWSRFCRDAGPEEMRSTYRQLSRYAYWWKVEETSDHARELIEGKKHQIQEIMGRGS